MTVKWVEDEGDVRGRVEVDSAARQLSFFPSPLAGEGGRRPDEGALWMYRGLDVRMAEGMVLSPSLDGERICERTRGKYFCLVVKLQAQRRPDSEEIELA